MYVVISPHLSSKFSQYIILFTGYACHSLCSCTKLCATQGKLWVSIIQEQYSSRYFVNYWSKHQLHFECQPSYRQGSKILGSARNCHGHYAQWLSFKRTAVAWRSTALTCYQMKSHIVNSLLYFRVACISRNHMSVFNHSLTAHFWASLWRSSRSKSLVSMLCKWIVKAPDVGSSSLEPIDRMSKGFSSSLSPIAMQVFSFLGETLMWKTR